MSERIRAKLIESNEAISAAEEDFLPLINMLENCTKAIEKEQFQKAINIGLKSLNQTKLAGKSLKSALKALPAINLVSACEGVQEDTVQKLITVFKVGESRSQRIVAHEDAIRLALYSSILNLRMKKYGAENDQSYKVSIFMFFGIMLGSGMIAGLIAFLPKDAINFPLLLGAYLLIVITSILHWQSIIHGRKSFTHAKKKMDYTEAKIDKFKKKVDEQLNRSKPNA